MTDDAAANIQIMTPSPSPSSSLAGESSLWPFVSWLFDSTSPWWATGVFALLTAWLTWTLSQRSTRAERERERRDRVRAAGKEHAVEALKILRTTPDGELGSDETEQEMLGHVRLIPDPEVRDLISQVSVLGLMVPPSQEWDEGEQYPSLSMTRSRLKRAAVDALEAWIREEAIADADRLSLAGIGNRARYLNDRHPPLGGPSWDWPVSQWAEGNPETEVKDVPNP